MQDRRFEGTLAGLAVAFFAFLVMRLAMVLLSPSDLIAQQAGIFWEENWSGSATLAARGWGTSSCVNYPGAVAPYAEGCNPVRSTQLPYPGFTHSLREDYTTPIIPDGGEGTHGQFITRQDQFATNDLWFRVWIRTSNFTYHSGGSTTKDFYILTQTGGDGNFGFPFVLGHPFGDRRQWIGTQGEQSNSAPCSGAPGGTFNSCFYPPNLASVPMADNQWYCQEGHIVHNTTLGVATGSIELWTSGVKTHAYFGRDFLGNPQNRRALSGIRIYVQLGSGLRFFGPFAVGNTRIGCGTTPPPADVTPPSTPTSLAAPSTNLPVTLTWTYPDMIPADFGGYKVYRRLGTCASGARSLLPGGTINGDTRTFTDTTVPVATTAVSYQVSSFDTSGNESALSTCLDESLTPPGGGETSASVATVTADFYGANITFNGSAHAISYFTMKNNNTPVEITGLGGVTSYRLSRVWTTEDGEVLSGTAPFTCIKAKGSDGIYQTGQICTGVPIAPEVPAFTPSAANLKVHPTNPIWLSDSDNNAVTLAGVGIDGCCSLIPPNVSRGVLQDTFSNPGDSPLITETFDGTDTDIGPNWNVLTSSNALNKSSGKARVSAVGFPTSMESLINVPGLDPSNQIAKGLMTDVPGSGVDAVLALGVRMSGSGTRKGYQCEINRTGALSIIMFESDGDYVVLKTGTHTFATSATIPYECWVYTWDGETELRIVRDGVSLLMWNTRNDAEKITTGTCGMRMYLASGAVSAFQVDNFVCGNAVVTNDDVLAFQTQNARGSTTARFLIRDRTVSGSTATFANGSYGRTPTTQMPWHKTGERIDTTTGTPIKVGIYDLDTPNLQFFADLRTAVQAANANHITPFINLFEGWCNSQCDFEALGNPFGKAANNIQGINGDTNNNGKCEECHRLGVSAITDRQKAYVRRVIDSVVDLRYVIEISNEDLESDVSAIEAWQDAMADEVEAHETSLGKTEHTILRSTWGPPSGFWSNYNHMFANTHGQMVAPGPALPGDVNYVTDPPESDGTKVVVMDMDHQGATTPYYWAWQNYLRGNYPVYLYEPRLGFDNATVESKAFARLKQVNEYGARIGLKDMSPIAKGATSVISSAFGLINPCQEILAYRPTSGTLNIDLSACTGDVFKAEILNASTGEITATSDVNGGATRSFNPGYGGDGDFVVYLKNYDMIPGESAPAKVNNLTVR